MNLIKDEQFQKELSGIWKGIEAIQPVFPPIYPETIIEGSIVFLSLNPSLSKTNEQAQYYPQPAMDTNIHPHFQKYTEIMDRLSISHLKWCAMDLLYVKQSN